MKKNETLKRYFKKYTDEVIKNFDFSKINQIIKKLENFNKQLLIFGNGGTSAIANHMANDFMNVTKIKTLSFSDSSLITCYSNDYGYENWVCKTIDNYSEKGDIVILMSSSGMSPNMIKAAKKCKKEKIFFITLSGFDKKNKLSKFGNIRIHVDSKSYNYVELSHLQILMAVVDNLKKN